MVVVWPRLNGTTSQHCVFSSGNLLCLMPTARHGRNKMSLSPLKISEPKKKKHRQGRKGTHTHTHTVDKKKHSAVGTHRLFWVNHFKPLILRCLQVSTRGTLLLSAYIPVDFKPAASHLFADDFIDQNYKWLLCILWKEKKKRLSC